MELHLDESTSKVNRPIISKVLVHDNDGNPLFSLEYDTITRDVVFNKIESDLIDQLITTKSALTTEKGVEAFGSFISGADNEVPLYRHLLSLFIPGEGTNFIKYHVTLETTLENFNFQSSLIYSAEFYSVCIDAINEYLEEGTISIDNYPMINSFFHRVYQYPIYSSILAGKTPDGVELTEGPVVDNYKLVKEILEDNSDDIDALDLYITTLSGAITAKKQFLSLSTDYRTLHHMLFSSITSPGMYCENGQVTLWFPFTKSKVGKINRALSTTLNTLNYATNKKNMQEQVQTNIAHKFQDMVEILTQEQSGSSPSFGLQTNIGHLVCSIRFKEEITNDMEAILRVSHLISDRVKQYGQAVLSTVAKGEGFLPIIS